MLIWPARLRPLHAWSPAVEFIKYACLVRVSTCIDTHSRATHPPKPHYTQVMAAVTTDDGNGVQAPTKVVRDYLNDSRVWQAFLAQGGFVDGDVVVGYGCLRQLV